LGKHPYRNLSKKPFSMTASQNSWGHFRAEPRRRN
jgi:hypothetical protein